MHNQNTKSNGVNKNLKKIASFLLLTALLFPQGLFAFSAETSNVPKSFSQFTVVNLQAPEVRVVSSAAPVSISVVSEPPLSSAHSLVCGNTGLIASGLQNTTLFNLQEPANCSSSKIVQPLETQKISVQPIASVSAARLAVVPTAFLFPFKILPFSPLGLPETTIPMAVFALLLFAATITLLEQKLKITPRSFSGLFRSPIPSALRC